MQPQAYLCVLSPFRKIWSSTGHCNTSHLTPADVNMLLQPSNQQVLTHSQAFTLPWTSYATLFMFATQQHTPHPHKHTRSECALLDFSHNARTGDYEIILLMKAGLGGVGSLSPFHTLSHSPLCSEQKHRHCSGSS